MKFFVQFFYLKRQSSVLGLLGVWSEFEMVLFVRLTLRLKLDTIVKCEHECGRKY